MFVDHIISCVFLYLKNKIRQQFFSLILICSFTLMSARSFSDVDVALLLFQKQSIKNHCSMFLSFTALRLTFLV